MSHFILNSHKVKCVVPFFSFFQKLHFYFKSNIKRNGKWTRVLHAHTHSHTTTTQIFVTLNFILIVWWIFVRKNAKTYIHSAFTHTTHGYFLLVLKIIYILSKTKIEFNSWVTTYTVQYKNGGCCNQ